MLPSVGAVTAKSLVSYCGSPKAVFEARKKELMLIPGIGGSTAKAILDQDVFHQAEEEVRFLEQHKVRTLFYLDKDYPARLKHHNDAPAILYYRGTADLNTMRTVGIVGTRKPSPRGVAITEELVDGLKAYGVQTISGLAFGIDVVSHRKSLEVNIPTIGVLGHGLRKIYPSQHYEVAAKMAENGGLLTEYFSFKEPDREHFPMRNRIVAGLCDALIVVESPRKGGSMITAKIANDYNKDVFAFPGRVKDKNAEGCHLLIKSHQAALIESVDDIAYVMRWKEIDAKKNAQRALFVEFTEDEKIVVDLLRENDEMGIDKLSWNCKLPYSKMASLLLRLEFKGVIKSIPGSQYVLI